MIFSSQRWQQYHQRLTGVCVWVQFDLFGDHILFFLDPAFNTFASTTIFLCLKMYFNIFCCCCCCRCCNTLCFPCDWSVSGAKSQKQALHKYTYSVSRRWQPRVFAPCNWVKWITAQTWAASKQTQWWSWQRLMFGTSPASLAVIPLSNVGLHFPRRHMLGSNWGQVVWDLTWLALFGVFVVVVFGAIRRIEEKDAPAARSRFCFFFLFVFESSQEMYLQQPKNGFAKSYPV